MLSTNATWFGFAAPQLEIVADTTGRKLLDKCMLSATYAQRHFQLFEAENRFE
jgi:hypothetical protein